MELTREYKMVAEAYLGTDSYGGKLYVRSYAKYSQQDMTNNRTYVHYEATANFTGSSIYDQQGNGSISGTGGNTVSRSVTSVSGDITIANTEGWVTHNADGTKEITATAKLSFPNWGWSATASGTATLPNLHKPPVLSNVEFTEQNSTLANLGVAGNYFVPYLSNKKLNITPTTYDDATITLYEAINRSKVYSSASNQITMNLMQNELYTTYMEFLHRDVVELSIRLTDSKGATSTTAYPYTYIIPYKKPTIERTSTSIKRKSGGGVNLTDNKATLNLKASIYKGSDAVGNNNSITQIGYKIWASDESEPGSYTALTPSIDSSGNITINNFEISNIVFTKVYNYKIKLTDNYNYTDEILDGKISTGVSLWSEYKDHVDFYALTVKGYNPFEYSTEETICGVWSDGFTEKTLYRKVIDIGSLPSNATKTTAHSISNLDMIVNLRGIAVRTSDKDTLPIPYVTFNANNSGGIILNANSTYVNVTTSTDRSGYNGYVVIEYTKS